MIRVDQVVDMAIFDKDETKSDAESHIPVKPASPPLMVNTPLKASNVNLFETQSDVLVADGYMYFQGTDQAVWRVNANLADAIFDYNNFGGPSRIKTQSNVFPTDGFMYFRGTDNKVWQMSTTEPYNPQNLGGFETNSNITISDGYMYFQGTDQAVWRVSVNNPTTDNNNFGGPNRIKTQSSIYVSGNYMYFRGTDNKVWQMSTTEPYNPINLGGFNTNSDIFPLEGYIYFQGTDQAVWRVSVTNPTTDNNNFGGPNRVKTKSNVYASGNYMYFQGTDNKVWQMSMTEPYDLINVGPMESQSNIFPKGNAIYFRGTDNKLWCYSFEILALEQYATAAVYALQEWYTGDGGIFGGGGEWRTTGWWNAARALYALIDFTRSTGSSQVRDIYQGVIQTTFEKQGGKNFLNDYYDDEGWWALAWINAYDLTGEEEYLNMAKTIFDDINGGWDNVCCGGVYWHKEFDFFGGGRGGGANKNTIPNELYAAVAVKLYHRSTSPDEQDSYKKYVKQAVNWFSKTGLLNPNNLINDGLNEKCKNNGGTAWSYNQGVIIGALCDINDMNDNSISWNGKNLLTVAMDIANAVIATSPPSILNKDGILIEPGDPAPSNANNPDIPQFKGIFMRNLARLVTAVDPTQAAPYVEFINNNVMSILENDRNPINQFGYDWRGPFDTADAARQSSALEALNAAIAVQASLG